MSRLEIIHLRSSARPVAVLAREIREAIGEETDGAVAVTVYRRSELDSDVAVHIHRGGEPATTGPSALGLHLAAALRAFGLVEHTFWEELR